jgi:hypothetical protein
MATIFTMYSIFSAFLQQEPVPQTIFLQMTRKCNISNYSDLFLSIEPLTFLKGHNCAILVMYLKT